MLNDDYRDMLRALSSEGVEYLLVGAYTLRDTDPAANDLPEH